MAAAYCWSKFWITLAFLGIATALPYPYLPKSRFDPKIDDFDLLAFSQSTTPTFHWRPYRGIFNSTGQAFTAYVGILSNAGYFSIKLPQEGCGHLEKTSSTAQIHNCLYATNGGYFDVKTGTCIGNLISDGVQVEISGSSRVNFGITSNSFIIGYLTNATIMAQKFNQLIQGAGWLVRSGESYVNKSKIVENISDNFVNLQAPRTSLGAFKNGSVGLFQVDGVELLKKGAKLTDLADWLIELDVFHAINLDGGGSSASVYNGSVIDKPTCHDVPSECERPVTTITCVHHLS